MPVCNNCEVKFPNYLYIEGKRRNISNRRFCIECSPFGSHNTSKYIPGSEADIERKKRRKEQIKILQRYNQQRLRTSALEKLGGRCSICSITDIRCLEIDHINGKGGKERKKLAHYSFLRQIIRGERKDVQLLCANCHAIKTWEAMDIKHGDISDKVLKKNNKRP